MEDRISQTFQYFPPKTQKESTPISKKQKTIPSSTTTFQLLFNGKEPQKAMEIREQLYRASLDKLDTLSKDVLKQVHEKVFDEIMAFIQTKAETSTLFPEELPLGLLSFGMNVQDHFQLLDPLVDHLSQTSLIYVLDYSDFQSKSLKQVVKKLTQLVNEEEESQDWEMICKWYQKTSKEKEPLVFVFSQVEMFSKSVLEFLFSIFSELRKRLPLVILFGTATSHSFVLGDLLPSSVLNGLQFRRFDLEHSQHCMNQLLEQWVMKQPLFLSYKWFKAMTDAFQQRHFSYLAFTRSLKYAIMTFYYAEPLSILTADDLKSVLLYLSHEHLELVRSLPSFQSLPAEDIQKYLYNDVLLLKDLPTMIQKVKESKDRFRLAFQSLSLFIEQLKSQKWKKEKWELLLVLASGDQLYLKHIGNLMKLTEPEALKPSCDYLSQNDVTIADDEALFQYWMESLKSSPLHELFEIQNRSNLMHKAFFPPNKAAIFSSLKNIGYYLGCECCPINQQPSNHEDVCLLYGIFEEFGRMVDLKQLKSVFEAVLYGRESAAKTDEEKDVALARFIEQLMTLEYLGMLKGCRSRPHHVQKLTWPVQ